MKSLVIYDSLYGNTEKIAKAMASTLPGKSVALPVHKVHVDQLKEYFLIIVGSPTHGGMPTAAIQEFINDLPEKSLKGMRTAAFDTRFSPHDHGMGLRILMGVINFASPRIAKALQGKGAILLSKPQGFIVEEKKGSIKRGRN